MRYDNRNCYWMPHFQQFSTQDDMSPYPLFPYDLDDKRIDVWQYPLTHESPEARLLLNEEELKRADRYYFPKHRRRFTVARATLRLILGKYVNTDPRELIFATNAYGKPSLVNAPALQFNLSHSNDTALLAIGQTHPLGVDLEFFAARPYEGIGSHMFSPNENHALKNTPPSLKPLTFFHIWAQKEAFIKACGLGLSYPTQTFDVSPFPSTEDALWDPQHHIPWKITTFMPKPTCCAALCYHPSIQDIRFKSFDPPSR